MQLLTTAAAWQTLRDYWDMDGAEAADVGTGVELLLEGARRRVPNPPTEPTEALMDLLTGINHVAVLTDDLDRFVEFYTGVFDLDVVFEESTPAFRHAILRTGPTRGSTRPR